MRRFVVDMKDRVAQQVSRDYVSESNHRFVLVAADNATEAFRSSGLTTGQRVLAMDELAKESQSLGLYAVPAKKEAV